MPRPRLKQNVGGIGVPGPDGSPVRLRRTRCAGAWDASRSKSALASASQRRGPKRNQAQPLRRWDGGRVTFGDETAAGCFGDLQAHPHEYLWRLETGTVEEVRWHCPLARARAPTSRSRHPLIWVRELGRSRARVTPSQQRTHSQLLDVSAALRSPGSVRAVATVKQRGGPPYLLRLYLERRAARWS